MRFFVKTRQWINGSSALCQEIEDLREEADGKFRIVFQTLEQLLAEESQPKKKIGFTAQEKLSQYG